MEQSYYILSKDDINIEKCHICTWDFMFDSARIELGLQITSNQRAENIKKEQKEVPVLTYTDVAQLCSKDSDIIDKSIVITLPFLNNKCTVRCLSQQLVKEENCRFIFNEIVRQQSSIRNDFRNGVIMSFDKNSHLAIIPCSSISLDIEHKLIVINLRVPKNIYDKVSLYTRILIETSRDSLAICKNAFTKKTYIYDIKVNETRNIPNNVFNYQGQNNLKICPIQKTYCLHSVPDVYNITFIDSSKLKNIRKLEKDAFHTYLPDIQSLKYDDYIIVFYKAEQKDGFSFFSYFTKERIDKTQIVIAFWINLICSILLTYTIGNKDLECFMVHPWLFVIGTIISLFLIFFMISGISYLYRFIRRFFSIIEKNKVY